MSTTKELKPIRWIESPIDHGRYSRNRDAGRGYETGSLECAICGKFIKKEKQVFWVHCIGGGMDTWLHPDSEKGWPRCNDDDRADLGCWPIGPDCYGKLTAEQKEFVTRVKAEKQS